MFLSPDSARKKDAATYPGLPLQENHIRVVRLLPGRWTEQIRCELSSANIEVANYRALSYVWGSQHVTRSIQLDGRVYPVTVNLEGALRHLREAYKDGLDLWIDALCINQKDGEERTHQVQLMGLIYKKCEECLVYLGDSLDGIGPSLTEAPSVWHFEEFIATQSGKKIASRNPGLYEVFSFFHDLASNKHLHTHLAFGNSAFPFAPGSEHEQTHFQSQLFEALRKFTHAPFTPWWTRIWVIQEVTTPPRVVIVHGTMSASWDIFAQGAVKYTHHSASCCKDVVQSLPSDQQKVISDSCKKITGIEQLRWSTLSSFITPTDPLSLGLLSLLTQFRDRKASDLRDKVYALLGMAWTPPGRSPLKPDYSLSEESVFCKAALESIYTTESLLMFSTELGRKFRNDLPSWVPDWGAPGGHTYAARTQAILLYNANCEKATPMTVKPIGELALRLRAARIMSVDVLGETMFGEDVTCTQKTLYQWWHLWESHTSMTDDDAPLTTPVYHLFQKLICAGVIHVTYDGLSCGVRTIQDYDAITFGHWRARSRINPFITLRHTRVADSPSLPMQLWKVFILLWPPQRLPRTPLSHDGHRDKYFPTGLDMYTEDGRKLIAQFCEDSYDSDDLPNFRLFDYFEGSQPRSHAPWKFLFIRFQRLVKRLCCQDIDLRIDTEESFTPGLDLRELSTPSFDTLWEALIPDIDNSINIATLSRRLIIGENSLRSSPVTSDRFFGLGPAETVSGDEVFLLTGGKTPFVLRQHTDTDRTVSGPKYKIVGDCYVQGWMEGVMQGLALDHWEDITLV